MSAPDLYVNICDVRAYPPKTVVVANRLDETKAWCRNHAVPPYGARTWMISTPDACHGLSLGPGDRLIVLDSTPEPVIFMLRVALVTAPGDVAGRFSEWTDRADDVEHTFDHTAA